MFRTLPFKLALAASTWASLVLAQAPADNSSVGADGAVNPAPTNQPPDAAIAAAAEGQPASTPASPTGSTSSAGATSASPASADVASSSGPKLEGKPGSGVTADFGDSFSLNLKARMQLRYQLDAAPPDTSGERALTQSVSVGTARLYIGGHAFSRDFTYLVQLALAARDYRDGATSPVYDAYVDYKWQRDVSFKLGQYFVPFDRLRTVREFALQISERPRVVQELTLDRDVGITIYSDHFLGAKSPVAYRVGAFGGGGMNLSAGKTPGMLGVARVELRPLGSIDDDQEGDLERRERPGLAFGIAGAANWGTNRQRSTTGAIYQAGVTDYYQGATDVVFKWLGFAAEAEFVVREASTDLIVSSDPTIADQPTQSGYGWVTQASYCFPFHLELSGRFSELYAMDGTDPAFVTSVANTGQEVAGGISYYLNGHKMKIQADYVARMPSGLQFDRAQQLAHLLFDITL
ncbi:MAG TPA: porin [Polyangiaceae bacterium]|nr:porin [Polyangiaceae bacterium]